MEGGTAKSLKSLKAVLFSALFLSFLLLNTTFISCAGGASGPKGSEAEGTALAIKLPDTAKTIYNKEDIVSFTVTVSSGSFTSTKSANKGETMLFSNLPVGTYSVKAYGKTSRGAVAAKCETSVTIVAGETTTTTLHLSRLEHWTVTFMNAGGSELSTQDISDGYKATKPADPAPVSGKNFSGWTTDAVPSDTSPLFDFNTAITGDITLRPVFGVITYTVKYVSPIGSFTASDFTAATASDYTLPSTSSVTGLTFAGWYADAAFSSTVDVASVRDITTFTKKDDIHYEKTIYAKWTAKVQFKGENISTHEMETIMTGFDGIWYGAKVSNPGDPTAPEGATFGGWYKGTVDGEGNVTLAAEAYDFNAAVTEDITLYAKWNFVTHNVTYVSVPRAVPTGTATEFREIEGIPTLPTISSPTAAGCSFVGWTQDENFTLDTTTITSIPANTTTDVTLYAIWKVGVYFMNDLGSTTSFVVYGGALTKPTDPTKSGATFGGWYKGTVDGEGNVTLATEAYDFDDADKNKVTQSIDLYPKWNVGISISGLSEYLSSLPAGTKESPNVLPPITGLTTSNWTQIKTALRANSTKYVDLSATVLPEGITDMTQGFFQCSKLVKAPTIPAGVTNMVSCFQNCSSLTEAPEIPNSVTIMNYCFQGCSSLTAAPAIPDGVTRMESSFFNCSSLTEAPTIPSSVTSINSCFQGCSSLTVAPTISDGVREMGACFENCSSLTAAPEIPNSVTNMRSCFASCSSLTVAPTIPDSVGYMESCFSDCEHLTGEIVINAEITNPGYWEGAFMNVPSGVTVKVKTGMKSVIETSASSDSSPYTLNCNIVEMP